MLCSTCLCVQLGSSWVCAQVLTSTPDTHIHTQTHCAPVLFIYTLPCRSPPPCQPGEYHFRFLVGDSSDLHPAMAVSDKYDREEVPNRHGQKVLCNKVSSRATPVAAASRWFPLLGDSQQPSSPSWLAGEVRCKRAHCCHAPVSRVARPLLSCATVLCVVCCACECRSPVRSAHTLSQPACCCPALCAAACRSVWMLLPRSTCSTPLAGGTAPSPTNCSRMARWGLGLEGVAGGAGQGRAGQALWHCVPSTPWGCWELPVC